MFSGPLQSALWELERCGLSNKPCHCVPSITRDHGSRQSYDSWGPARHEKSYSYESFGGYQKSDSRDSGMRDAILKSLGPKGYIMEIEFEAEEYSECMICAAVMSTKPKKIWNAWYVLQLYQMNQPICFFHDFPIRLDVLDLFLLSPLEKSCVRFVARWDLDLAVGAYLEKLLLGITTIFFVLGVTSVTRGSMDDLRWL